MLVQWTASIREETKQALLLKRRSFILIRTIVFAVARVFRRARYPRFFWQKTYHRNGKSMSRLMQIGTHRRMRPGQPDWPIRVHTARKRGN
jgi:hypothetical protein